MLSVNPLYYSIGPSLRGIAPLRAQAGQTAGCWRSRASFSPATWRVGGLSRTLKGVYMGSIRVPLKGSIRGLGGSGLVSRVSYKYPKIDPNWGCGPCNSKYRVSALAA